MEKIIRKAVRCFVIDNDKVLCMKYKQGRVDYWDIPGGKIEPAETPVETSIREVKEETGVNIHNLLYRGNMILEYADRIYDFDLFYTDQFEGTPKDFAENYACWMNIDELLTQEKVLADVRLLDNKYRDKLLKGDKLIKINIVAGINEEIIEVNYEMKDNL